LATEPYVIEDRSYLTRSVSGVIIDILNQEVSRQTCANWNKRRPSPEGSRFISLAKADFDETMLLKHCFVEK